MVPRASLSLAILISPSIAFAGETVIDSYYAGDVIRNTDGGLRTGTAYLDDAGLTVSTEFNALFGDSTANFFAYFLWNNGTTFSDEYVGDLQVVSNVDTGEALRIYEFWYEQEVAKDITLRFGLYDLNSEFDAIETAGLFINSSHGIGAEIAQSGQNGPSIFPNTSLTARFDWQVNANATLRYAILDGVPGDPDHPSRTTIQLGGGDGVLQVLEYNHVLWEGTRLGVGGWLYSAEFDVINTGTPVGQPPAQEDGNGGMYGFVDFPLYSNRSTGLEISTFLRYGVANDDVNPLDSYLGAGTTVKGLFARRPEDLLGLAIARAQVGDPQRQAMAAAGIESDSYEMSVELTYSAQVTSWLRLQPNIQYVVNPGADPSLDDALVIGLRFELTTSSDAISHEWP